MVSWSTFRDVSEDQRGFRSLQHQISSLRQPRWGCSKPQVLRSRTLPGLCSLDQEPWRLYSFGVGMNLFRMNLSEPLTRSRQNRPREVFFWPRQDWMENLNTTRSTTFFGVAWRLRTVQTRVVVPILKKGNRRCAPNTGGHTAQPGEPVPGCWSEGRLLNLWSWRDNAVSVLAFEQWTASLPWQVFWRGHESLPIHCTRGFFLEKAYNRILLCILWEAAYSSMGYRGRCYEPYALRITTDRKSNKFPLAVGLHQGCVLSLVFDSVWGIHGQILVGGRWMSYLGNSGV